MQIFKRVGSKTTNMDFSSTQFCIYFVLVVRVPVLNDGHVAQAAVEVRDHDVLHLPDQLLLSFGGGRAVGKPVIHVQVSHQFLKI